MFLAANQVGPTGVVIGLDASEVYKPFQSRVPYLILL